MGKNSCCFLCTGIGEAPNLLYWMTSEASISDVRSLSTGRQNLRRRTLHERASTCDVEWCREGTSDRFDVKSNISMNKESLMVNFIFVCCHQTLGHWCTKKIKSPFKRECLKSDVLDYAYDVQIYHENWFSKFWMTFTACHMPILLYVSDVYWCSVIICILLGRHQMSIQ